MISRLFYWLPRILMILSLVFMTMFSLDSFGGNETIVRKFLGFLIHNIPVFILAILLVIAWKWELPGGILIILAAIAGSVYFRSFSGNPGSLVVIAPFLIEGVLFVLYGIVWAKPDKNKS
jgi:hypothetical protein